VPAAWAEAPLRDTGAERRCGVTRHSAAADEEAGASQRLAIRPDHAGAHGAPGAAPWAAPIAQAQGEAQRQAGG
jgi:hypothetical protein